MQGCLHVTYYTFPGKGRNITCITRAKHQHMSMIINAQCHYMLCVYTIPYKKEKCVYYRPGLRHNHIQVVHVQSALHALHVRGISHVSLACLLLFTVDLWNDVLHIALTERCTRSPYTDRDYCYTTYCVVCCALHIAYIAFTGKVYIVMLHSILTTHRHFI